MKIALLVQLSSFCQVPGRLKTVLQFLFQIPWIVWPWFSVLAEEVTIVLPSLSSKRNVIKLKMHLFQLQLHLILVICAIESWKWSWCKGAQDQPHHLLLCSSGSDLCFKHLSEVLAELWTNCSFLLCFLRCLLNSHYVWWGLRLPHKIPSTWWFWSRKDQPSLPIYRWQI